MSETAPRRRRNPFANLAMASIRWYQRNISAGMPARCRYSPTCSQYGLEAIQVHGLVKGTLLAVWRILRCNPWTKGGVDWVPKPGKWPAKPLGQKDLLELWAKEDQERSRGASSDSSHGDECNR